MEIGAEFRGAGQEIQQFVADGRRFDRGDADAFEARYAIELSEQGTEVMAVVEILAEVHSREHDLAIPARTQAVRLLQNVLQPSASFVSPRERNDAKAAHGAAPVLNLQRRPRRV